ncbi:MAG: tannase/feruloyl esterase family alpha/beta hydrolase [Planctomycetes bacterium]|nr:tannase/feruloyl esterase family alpha/beta hydrolase [Planctomycetota bacterium]
MKGLPPRTVVRLTLRPEQGSNIVVAVWLPDAARWNGRLLGLGNGGAAGGINERSLAGRAAGGYAVATTDMGTAPNPASGNGNPAVWRDFGHRATHLMTVAAKQIVRAAYGRDAERCYFVGGSTGGQQALQEAQRHPEDYDGIVANVPAHCRAPLHAYFLWNHQILARSPFTEAQQKAVITAANQHVATREPPATAGRMVSDPRCTPADIAAVIARARSADPSISDAQAEALRQLFDGPRHAVTGERIFNGVPLGSSWNNARGHLYLFHWVFGAQQDLLKLDWNADIDRYLAALGPDLNAEDDDLGRFRDHGGRLLMVSGSADPIVPYHATLDYYERLVERAGSLAAAQAFCRFYLIPGMGHGSEGPGVNTMPDLLALVVDWREKGIAPQALRARRLVDGKTELDLQILPYPGSADGPRGGVERIADRFRRPPAR